jgi:hypothetical protein
VTETRAKAEAAYLGPQRASTGLWGGGVPQSIAGHGCSKAASDAIPTKAIAQGQLLCSRTQRQYPQLQQAARSVTAANAGPLVLVWVCWEGAMQGCMMGDVLLLCNKLPCPGA